MDNVEKIRRLDVIINSYKSCNKNFLSESIKTLRHIIYLVDNKEDAEELILWAIYYFSKHEVFSLEQTQESVRDTILQYATEARLELQKEIN